MLMPAALMPAARFCEVVREYISDDENAVFSVVLFRTKSLTRLARRQFLELLTGQVRRAELDLVARHEEGVAVYLHGRRPRDARRFVARLLVRWVGSGGGEVPFVVFGYPADDTALLEFIGDSSKGEEEVRASGS